jgi:hypothetical protein
MDKQQASKELAALVIAAYEALGAAETFAIEHELNFSFAPTRGMGGYFDPESIGRECYDSGEVLNGWNPSSRGC